jgi:hypothetical protein
LEDDKKFAVQFLVVKNEDNDEDNDGIVDSQDQDDGRLPFKQNHFLKAGSLVGRMKVIGHLKTVAGLHVASFKHVSGKYTCFLFKIVTFKVTNLYPIEQYADNSLLIIQASIAAVFMFLTCLCGCHIACKKKKQNDYEAAELQK